MDYSSIITTKRTRFNLLEELMGQPGFFDEPKKSRELTQEHRQLSNLLRDWDEYQRQLNELSESQEMLKSGDEELTAMAAAEIPLIEKKLVVLENAVQFSILPPDPLEGRDALVEIRAGTGGDEASLFAADLVRMYTRFAETRGWKTEMLESSPSDVGGFKEVVMKVAGEDVFRVLKYESGVHRVQRVPATEGLGRVHTSTAVVVVLPAADEEQGGVDLRPEDIQVDVFRSGGAGGQHVNTTESAVRLTHKPTGIKVSCQNERSQHMNKATAMKVLRARVEAHEKQLAREARDALRADVASTGARSERIRTYNFADDRVTDHRLGESKYGIPRMLAGELLEELVEDLAMKHALEKREEFLRALEDA